MNESTAPEGTSADAATTPRQGNGPEMNGSEESRSATTPSSADMGAAAVARAEELLDSVGQRLGSWATSLEHTLRLLGARAREEAEDMLAEAQSLRAGNDHQQTTHAHVIPTSRVERIDEVPPDRNTTDQEPADRAPRTTPPEPQTATEGVYRASAETATPTPDAADVP